MPKRCFEKLLLEAVDEGLSSLGQTSRQAIYFHLEKSFSIKKQEIPCKIEVFADAMEKIFGGGANFLEILIVKRLHEKTGATFEFHGSTDFVFVDYVTEVKKSLLKKNKTRNLAEKIVLCEEIGIEA